MKCERVENLAILAYVFEKYNITLTKDIFLEIKHGVKKSKIPYMRFHYNLMEFPVVCDKSVGPSDEVPGLEIEIDVFKFKHDLSEYETWRQRKTY